MEKGSGKFHNLKSSMETLLLKAGCTSEQQFNILNFNIAAYSLELCRNAILKTGHFKQETFEAYISREWKASYNSNKNSPQKSELCHLLGSAKEKLKFTKLIGKSESPDQCDRLYFPKSQMIGFILEERAPRYNNQGKNICPEEIELWRWIFGEDKDHIFQKTRTDFIKLFNDVNTNTRELLNLKDSDSNTDQIKSKANSTQDKKDHFTTLKCPSCSSLIRFDLPITNSLGKCGGCKAPFIIKGDNQGNIWLEGQQATSQPRPNQDVIEALALLGLDENPTKEQIKSAYRRKISEYHPDKVHALGDKLKNLAAEESKKINLAVETLKKSGYF